MCLYQYITVLKIVKTILSYLILKHQARWTVYIVEISFKMKIGAELVN